MSFCFLVSHYFSSSFMDREFKLEVQPNLNHIVAPARLIHIVAPARLIHIVALAR